MGSGDILRGLVARELAERTEPWARKLLDPTTGEAYPDVAAALAQVAAALERAESDDAMTEAPSREGLVAWLIDTMGVDPDDPRTAQRSQLQAAVGGQFDDRGERQPTERALDALTELVLGAQEQAHPRARWVASPDLVVDTYLRGGEPSPAPEVVIEEAEAIEIEAVPLTRPVPRPTAPSHAASTRRAPARAKAGAKKKKAASKKTGGRARTARARRAAPSRGRKRAGGTRAKKRVAKKRVAQKRPIRTRKRAVARHARRKKK
jgi:hypothetical protein